MELAFITPLAVSIDGMTRIFEDIFLLEAIA
jgi:hypothetical protein